MPFVAQYQIEFIHGKNESPLPETLVTKMGVNGWERDFGKCRISEAATSKAICSSWSIETQYPLRIKLPDGSSPILLLFANKGVLILQTEVQKPILVPSTILLSHSHPTSNSMIFLPKKGIYQFMTIRIQSLEEGSDTRLIVPGLLVDRLLMELFVLVDSGKDQNAKMDSLMEFLIKEISDEESQKPDSSDLPLTDQLQIMEEMKEQMILQMEEPFSLVKFSIRHHIHPARLTSLFKQENGCTPAVYLRNARLQKAKQLLRDPFKKIQDIALETGFLNPGTFSRLFKTNTGISPGLYRKINGQHKSGPSPGES